jgi:UDP-N-acetylmuramoylalanine--D-glutamate ligase
MNGLYIEKNKIAVIGFGISGKSVARYFLKNDIEVDVFEDKKQQDFDLSTILEFTQNKNFSINFEVPVDTLDVQKYDYVIASPGVWTTHPLVLRAKKESVEFVTDINIFLRIFRAQFPLGKVISITGSNGKSTTVSLMQVALKAADIDVYLGGNIGTSPLDFFDEIQTDEPVIILETSSYQLEYLKQEDYFDIAGITNISDNHLNRYQGKKDVYARAKLGGIDSDDTDVIVNLDDEDSRKYIVPNLPTKNVLGVQFESNTSSDVITMENNSLVFKIKGVQTVFVSDVTKMKLKGIHNLYNCAFVCAVLSLLEIKPNANIEDAIYNFSGLIHRVQFVDTVNSVAYINDSKSTSPDATSKALETLGTTKNIILISGGNDKDISYDAMLEGWKEFVKGLILLPGSANPKLKNLAQRSDVELLAEVQTMQEAFEIAQQSVEEGGIVLLSPATDSHASFKSFEDRGNQFIQCVQELKR